MMKKVRITENELVSLIQNIIREDVSPVSYFGRKISVQNGVLLVTDSNGKVNKIRLSSGGKNWNLKNISVESDGIQICGKICKTIESDDINKILKFVDTNKNTMVIEPGFPFPDINFTKLI